MEANGSAAAVLTGAAGTGAGAGAGVGAGVGLKLPPKGSMGAAGLKAGWKGCDWAAADLGVVFVC